MSQPPPTLPELPDKTPTQPKRPTQPLIPAPPQAPKPAPVRTRRPRRVANERGAWLSALGIALLLSLVIALVFLLGFVIFLPPEYTDPFIPGRLATRTLEAQQARATQDALNARATALQDAQHAQATQAALQSTQAALAVLGTSSAIGQTATAAALGFDATRTRSALEAQNAMNAATLAALQFSLTQTFAAATPLPRSTRVITATPPLERGGQAAALPTTDQRERFNTLFTDDFQASTLDPAWIVLGTWTLADGKATSALCGASLLAGNSDWTNFRVQTEVQGAGGIFALTLGYGERGRLYVQFNGDGALSWLTDGGQSISAETLANAYTPQQPVLVEVASLGRVVSVSLNGRVVAERLLPQATRGEVGIYTCPSGQNQPRFEFFRVARLEN